ncbi:hypothetical protein GKZ68_06675 [Hymenobacter sp. BRD128]|uniref:hypothetical protein n=1 Tax=Hymenobacter sp. BRD128 TaxID=2675878 RepID=UPI00156771D7|nr:hypothetical protein [Hymenobacter sp. BRD128]QKG56350.1 hypothetical protein GKZ68_06675 [Hymenobacter sp. BRD128]
MLIYFFNQLRHYERKVGAYRVGGEASALAVAATQVERPVLFVVDRVGPVEREAGDHRLA